MARIRNGKVQIATEIPLDLRDALDRRAAAEGVTPAAIVRRAIRFLLEENEPERVPLPASTVGELHQMTATELRSMRVIATSLMLECDAAAARLEASR